MQRFSLRVACGPATARPAVRNSGELRLEHFADRLAAAITVRRTAAVVGIDPLLERLPAALVPRDVTLPSAVAALERFSQGVIDAVAPFVPAVKVNSAFFEAFYECGVAAYFRLVEYAHAAGLLVIGDIKRGDIGSTAQLYARGHIAPPSFADVSSQRIPDAVTLAGYLGQSAVDAFIQAGVSTGRGVYVLVRPSDPGADVVHDFGPSPRFYEHMASLVSAWGASPALRGECGLSLVGAVVAPKDVSSTAALRSRLPHTPFLVPGYGAQGASPAACAACFLPGGRGAVINASRSVIFAHQDQRYTRLHGEDWQACIRAACAEFVADIAGFAGV